jgi:hypothetical protein
MDPFNNFLDQLVSGYRPINSPLQNFLAGRVAHELSTGKSLDDPINLSNFRGVANQIATKKGVDNFTRTQMRHQAEWIKDIPTVRDAQNALINSVTPSLLTIASGKEYGDDVVGATVSSGVIGVAESIRSFEYGKGNFARHAIYGAMGAIRDSGQDRAGNRSPDRMVSVPKLTIDAKDIVAMDYRPGPSEPQSLHILREGQSEFEPLSNHLSFTEMTARDAVSSGYGYEAGITDHNLTRDELTAVRSGVLPRRNPTHPVSQNYGDKGWEKVTTASGKEVMYPSGWSAKRSWNAAGNVGNAKSGFLDVQALDATTPYRFTGLSTDDMKGLRLHNARNPQDARLLAREVKSPMPGIEFPEAWTEDDNYQIADKGSEVGPKRQYWAPYKALRAMVQAGGASGALAAGLGRQISIDGNMGTNEGAISLYRHLINHQIPTTPVASRITPGANQVSKRQPLQLQDFRSDRAKTVARVKSGAQNAVESINAMRDLLNDQDNFEPVGSGSVRPEPSRTNTPQPSSTRPGSLGKDRAQQLQGAVSNRLDYYNQQESVSAAHGMAAGSAKRGHLTLKNLFPEYIQDHLGAGPDNAETFERYLGGMTDQEFSAFQSGAVPFWAQSETV